MGPFMTELDWHPLDYMNHRNLFAADWHKL
jgi:hypothetical protein